MFSLFTMIHLHALPSFKYQY
uniref:Uncharacterized protein n=1 Tax=Arundo donax TaxID=35708 RepID=A0A0A9GT53_ARUDO